LQRVGEDVARFVVVEARDALAPQLVDPRAQ